MSKKNNQTNQQRPLLQFDHVERRTFKAQIDDRILNDLDAYAKYIESQTGHAPSVDEVAEKAMAKTLNSDAGFKEWQRSQKPKLVTEETAVESPKEERPARVKEANLSR